MLEVKTCWVHVDVSVLFRFFHATTCFFATVVLAKVPESFLLAMLTRRALTRLKPVIFNSCWRWHTSLSQPPVLFKASEFPNLFEQGPTEAAYANTVLATMNQQRLGMLCQEWARETLQRIHPKRKFMDPEVGMCCNGRKRGSHQAAYDFLMDEQRVEVKSSRMTWSKHNRSWLARFWNVKFPIEKLESPFDGLYLVLASPAGLALIKHDLCTAIYADGKRTASSGHTVLINSSRDLIDWQEALTVMLDKLCKRGNCSMVAQQSFGDTTLQRLLTTRESKDNWHSVYDGLPWCNLVASARGLRIQQMGFSIDQKLNPESNFLLLKEEFNSSGGLRGIQNASFDWMRDGVQVEIKSCRLLFPNKTRGWHCFWQSIKPTHFNELWLAIYSPGDIRFYKCSCAAGLRLSTVGMATEDLGLALHIVAPSKEEDPWRALQVIESKLLSRGCTPVAVVEWEPC